MASVPTVEQLAQLAVSINARLQDEQCQQRPTVDDDDVLDLHRHKYEAAEFFVRATTSSLQASWRLLGVQADGAVRARVCARGCCLQLDEAGGGVVAVHREADEQCLFGDGADELDVGWLRSGFAIERRTRRCFTVADNPAMRQCMQSCAALVQWTGRALRDDSRAHVALEPAAALPDYGVDFDRLTVSAGDVALLDAAVARQYPTDAAAPSWRAAVQRLRRAVAYLASAVLYLDSVLRTDIARIVGQAGLSAADFEQLVLFRARQLFTDDHQLTPLAYSVADGSFAVESEPHGRPVHVHTAATPRALHTLHCRTVAGASHSFAIDAAVYRHVHTAHAFLGQPPPALCLAARSKQFSQFFLLLGRLHSHRTASITVDVLWATLLRSRDQVAVPLSLQPVPDEAELDALLDSTLPSSFRSTARSLLATMADCGPLVWLVVPLRPHLERALGLPDGSLRRELRFVDELAAAVEQHGAALLAALCERVGDEHEPAARLERCRSALSDAVASVSAVPAHWPSESSSALIAVGPRRPSRFFASVESSDVENVDKCSCLFATAVHSPVAATRLRHASLLAQQPASEALLLAEPAQRHAAATALSLLDALACAGPLSADVHALYVATHCYDRSLLGMVLREHTNPLDCIDRSLLLMACALLQAEPHQLVRDGQYAALAAALATVGLSL